ncbi:MAG: AMP-binding protein, partial [Dehalococcoidia bacterium]|nr:AMP-binding protein [Dehalococcoidia bacterium]
MPILMGKDDTRIAQEESRKRFGHPFTTYLCCPPEKVTTICSTSGTTGEPTYYALTENDLKVNDEVWSRVYWRAGMRPGDKALHAFGMSMWILGAPLVRALWNMGVTVIPVGAEAGTTRILQVVNRLRPQWILATPAVAEHMIEKAPEAIGKEVGELGVKGIICTGAPGAGIPAVRKKITEAFGCKLFDSSGGGYGIHHVSCDVNEYQGMHIVSHDHHIWLVDLVDPKTGAPLPEKDGVIGEGILTSLDQEAAPLLKYKWGDMLQILTKPCVCGDTSYRMKILSRVDDMIIVKGVNVYPTAVKDVINGFIPRTTGEMRLVIEKEGVAQDPPVKVKVEYGKKVKSNELEGLGKEIEQQFFSILRFRAAIEFVPPMSLERAGGNTQK